MVEADTPVVMSVPKEEYDAVLLKPAELDAVIQFMSRATLQGSEAMAFIQCMHKLEAMKRYVK